MVKQNELMADGDFNRNARQAKLGGNGKEEVCITGSVEQVVRMETAQHAF